MHLENRQGEFSFHVDFKLKKIILKSSSWTRKPDEVKNCFFEPVLFNENNYFQRFSVSNILNWGFP